MREIAVLKKVLICILLLISIFVSTNANAWWAEAKPELNLIIEQHVHRVAGTFTVTKVWCDEKFWGFFVDYSGDGIPDAVHLHEKLWNDLWYCHGDVPVPQFMIYVNDYISKHVA